jgi:leucine-zipper of insertion element IS481
VELLKAPIHDPEVLVAHANAALTPRMRLRLARAVVEDGWTVSYAAAVFQVAYPTAKRWAGRYRQAGPAGMVDRSSRPHRCPRRTRGRWSGGSCTCAGAAVWDRWRSAHGWACRPSTVYAVLRRCQLHRLSHIDRRTSEPIRRYEHERPGSLLHVDAKKLGNIPDGGGWRYLGREQGRGTGTSPPGHPGEPGTSTASR